MVLIYIDQDDQEIKKASFEAISYGAALAKQLGLSAEAILLGTVKNNVSELGKYGANKVHQVNNTALNNFAINYWKKYENRNDFEAYFRALQIYDFTLFKYIKRLLPQRVNSIVGLVVEPNVLTIQAGTIILGDTVGTNSALVINRGAKIIANGTPTLPIVMTSSAPPGQRRGGDWGGY